MKRWGENKLIFEEAILAALIAAAFGLLAGGAVLPAPAFRAGLTLIGLDFDGGRSSAWAAQHFLLAALGCVLPLSCAVFAAGLAFWLFGWQRSSWHFEGMEFVADPDEYAPHLARHEHASFSQGQVAAVKSGAGHPRGIHVGGVELSRTREVGHVVVYGLPGAGKTTLLRSILKQVFKRGDRALVHDTKGDFLDALGRPELVGKVVILGPWDERARPWAIAQDVNTPERAVAFASGFFDSSSAGQNAFFVDSARELLAAVIKHLQKRRGVLWGWGDLAALLSSTPDALLAAAHDGEPMTRSLAPDADGKETRSVLAQLMSKTVWIGAYAQAFDADKAPFSLSAWLADPGAVQAVVFNSDARYLDRASSLFGAMLGAVASTIASPAMPEQDADARGWWAIIDELPQLGEGGQKAVQLIEEMGRSRGVRVVGVDPTLVSPAAISITAKPAWRSCRGRSDHMG